MDNNEPNNRKISPELNIANNVDERILLSSPELSDGYIEQFGIWELIVRYNGDFSNITKEYDINGFNLGYGFGILYIKKDMLTLLENDNRIIYIDKPKEMYFEASTADAVMISVIDSGIDIFNNNFYIIENGIKKSLIYEIYDIESNRVYVNEEINELLNSDDYINLDISGHGTAVTGVLLDNIHDIPYKLVVVRLGSQNIYGSSDTSAILMGLSYVSKKALEQNLPLIVNLSYGNNYGDHNGGSILEQYIDILSASQRVNIITGMGNDASTKRHAQIMLGNKSRGIVELSIGEYQSALSIQIYRRLYDKTDIVLVSPEGNEYGPLNSFNYISTYNTPYIYINSSEGTSPFSQFTETYISLTPRFEYLTSGIWRIVLIPKSIQYGRVDLWLPSGTAINNDTGFIQASPSTTFTIPAGSESIISVGSYNPTTLSYAGFSGRGYTVEEHIKPDVSAPGVDIPVILPGNVEATASGTSFSAPYAAAYAAKLMNWGIVEGNDPYMYGQKLKARMIEESFKLPQDRQFPNELLGWGLII